MTAAEPNETAPVAIPITGELDLHTFRPADLGELIPAYLSACRERGILRVRIIHGKGTGTLQRTTHALLARVAGVRAWQLADASSGGWGATWVDLSP